MNRITIGSNIYQLLNYVSTIYNNLQQEIVRSIAIMVITHVLMESSNQHQHQIS